MPMRDERARRPWVSVREEAVFECPYFRARQDTVHDGEGRPRTYFHIAMRNYGIAVVPVDSQGRTILVGQYRYLLGKFTWEVVRGGGPLHLPPLDSAKSELGEETGYRAGRWLEVMRESASPGVTNEMAIGFVAWDLEEGIPHPEPSEQLVQRQVPFAEAVSMVLSGEISDLASSSLLLSIQIRLDRGQLPADLRSCLRPR